MAKNTNYVVNVSSSEFKKLLELQQQSLTQLSAIKALTELSKALADDRVKEDEVVNDDQLKATQEVSDNIKDLIDLTKESSKNIAKMVDEKTPKTAAEKIKEGFANKFGSLRNTLDTMGMVKKGSGGFIDSALNRRESDKNFIKGDMKLNGTTEQEARNKLVDIKEQQKHISTNEKEIQKFTKLGISEEQLRNTTEGKKLLETRETSTQNLAKMDYRVEEMGVDSKKKLPMGNTPMSVIKSGNPAIKTDELELESIKREETQTELLRIIANNTKPKDAKDIGKPGEEEGGLGTLGLLIGGLVGGLIGFARAWVKTIKLFFETLVPESLKKFISEKFQGIGKFFEEMGGKVKSLFSFGEESKLGKFIEGFKDGLSKLTKPFVAAYDAVKGLIGGSEFLSKIFSSISEYISKFGKYIGKVAVIAEKLFFPLFVIMTVWDTVKGAFEGFEKGGLIGAIGGAIKGLFNSLIFGLADLIKDAVSWVAGALGFKNIEKMLDSFSFEKLFSDFVDMVLFIPQKIQDLIMHPIDSLKQLGSLVTDAFGKIGEVFKPVTDFFKGMGASIIGMLQSISIPEIGFTIPVVNQKVSVGPFYPFGKAETKQIPAGNSTAGAGRGSAEAAATDPRRVDVATQKGNEIWKEEQESLAKGLKSLGSENSTAGASPQQMLAQRDIARAQAKAALVAPDGNGSGTLRQGVATGVASPIKSTESKEEYTKIAGERVIPGQPLSDKQMAVMSMSISSGNKYPAEIMNQYNKQSSKANAITPTVSSGNIVAGKSNEVSGAKEDLTTRGGGGTAVVNAPTTVNNTTNQSNIIKSPYRNEEGSYNKYIGSRYGAY
jgi:hypothetical protein